MESYPAEPTVTARTLPLRALWGRRWARNGLKVLWILLLLAFVAVALVRDWSAIGDIQWTGERYALLAGSLAATLLRRLAGGLRWHWLLRDLRGNSALSLRANLRVYFISNLATYLPGTFWFIPGRMVMNAKHGVSKMQTAVVSLVEHFLLIVSGGLLALLGLDIAAQALGVSLGALWWVAPLTALGLIAVHPTVIGAGTRLLARVLRVEPAPIGLTYTDTLLQLVWSIVVWLLGAASLLLLTRALYDDVGLAHFGLFASIFATSWLIGFFTPFAPGGLGVREGILGLALTALGIPLGTVVVVAALSRLLLIVEDVTWGLIGYRL